MITLWARRCIKNSHIVVEEKRLPTKNRRIFLCQSWHNDCSKLMHSNGEGTEAFKRSKGA
jgi:hypothetical protein